MLDNIADLLLTVSLLALTFGFPANFAIRYMIPGTAIGVLAGDLLFFWLALSLARRTGRNDITAMPLGLDTPSTFGMVYFVLGPAFLAAKAKLGITAGADLDDPRIIEAALECWRIGICCIFISGLFKIVCATGSNWIRRVIPRAGLLGSLAAIALVLISFLPLMEVFHFPVVGMTALAIILTSLVARVRLPGRMPGALGALLVAGVIYYIMVGAELLHPQAATIDPYEGLLPHEWLTAFQFQWIASLKDSLQYMPIVIPFALGTVVGGIDCTESAAAVGDEYDTRRVILIDAFATLVGSLCGGVIQTTPYIGHPAYKAMGGRAAYTLATALFIGSAGVFGYFGYLYLLIPKAVVFPILVFIGLEITAQSFRATPKRHYPAIALGCIPALAALAAIYINKILGELGAFEKLSESLQQEISVVRIVSNGFIVTSLLWASALAAIIDRRLSRGAIFFSIAALCCFFGVIHSPLADGSMFLPWRLEAPLWETPLRFGAGYLLAAGLLWGWRWQLKIVDDEPLVLEDEVE